MVGEENKAKRGRNELESTDLSQADNIIKLLEGLSTKMDSLNVTVSGNSDAIKEIDTRLSTKIDNLESVVAENINRVKTEMDIKINSFTTDINKRFEDLASATNTSCRSIAKANEDVIFKIDNVQLENESRFNKLERELLRNELVLTGIPATYGENVFDIIGDICEAINCQVRGQDISAAYRLPSSTVNSARYRKGRQPDYSLPILLKLNNDWAKQDLVSAYFRKKNLSTADIGYQSKARIYINESLTKHNRNIFKAATEAKKSNQIVKCYTRNGIVHVQLNLQGKIHRINCIDHLYALTSNPSSQTNQTISPMVPPNASTQHSTNQSSLHESTQKSTNSTEILQTKPSTTPELQPPLHDEENMEG